MEEIDFIEYQYKMMTNYMELTMYNVSEKYGAKLNGVFYVPFAFTIIRTVVSNSHKYGQECVGFDIVSNQMMMTPVYRVNTNNEQFKNRFLKVEGEKLVDKSFAEFLQELLDKTALPSAGTPVNFSDLLGNVNELKNKNVFQAKLVSNALRYYTTPIYDNRFGRDFDVKCFSLGIDFTGFEFNPCYQYELLIDTYKRKKYKRRSSVTREKKYSKSKYKHADQLSMRDTNRINEIGFDPFKDNVCFFDFNQHNYFLNSIPCPTGIGKQYRKLNLGFRLRITDREKSIETDYICYCKMLMNLNNDGIQAISFCK